MPTRRPGRRGGNSSNFRRPGPRRAVQWFDFHVNQTVSSGSQNVLTVDSNLGEAEKKGCTLIRTLLDLWVMPTTTGTGGTAGMGLAILHEEGIAASAVPDTDVSDDRGAWLWKVFFPFFTSDLNDQAQAVRFKEDLRGMRKYPTEDHDLVLIMDNATGATSFNVDGLVRILCKMA